MHMYAGIHHRLSRLVTIMGLWAAPRKTRDWASEALAPLKLALSLGSPCTEDEQGEDKDKEEEQEEAEEDDFVG